jgi:hypothetical protein
VTVFLLGFVRCIHRITTFPLKGCEYLAAKAIAHLAIPWLRTAPCSEMMRVGVPLGSEGHQPFGESGLVCEIRNPQASTVQDAGPLPYLLHPNAVRWRKVKNES